MLAELQCRSARPREKPYKLADSLGLYLHVRPSGYRCWRMKYRWRGREKLLTFGSYPDISLRDAARRSLRAGRDPAEPETTPTFEEYARRWHAEQAPLWKATHAAQVLASLERDAFPLIGHLPIGEIEPADVKRVLLAVQSRSADIAHRVRSRLSRIFARTVADELMEFDPAATVAAVLRPVREGRFPAVVTIEEARALLEEFERAPMHPVIRLAHRLLALTAVRPGVIRMTPRADEFSGLSGPSPTWTIPAARMKLDRAASEDSTFDFVVPLSRQAADVVRVAQRFAGGNRWLFPSGHAPRKPISENALSYAIARHLPGRAGTSRTAGDRHSPRS